MTVTKKSLDVISPNSITEQVYKEEEDKETERGKWDNQCEFFLSCLGYAVGFGNVWRFPYLCYKNGGAVFLIPYFISLLCAGLPLFFLELCIGQYSGLGANMVFPEIAPIFAGLGWGMVAISVLVGFYYNIILAWTFFYTFASFASITTEVAWGSCNNTFNTPACYDEVAALSCNKSQFYYNHDCLDIVDYCGVGGLDVYNTTHCIQVMLNVTMYVPANTAIKSISASEDYFRNRVLGITDRTWEDMGSMRWELVGCNALAWAVVAACMIKGVKSSGKVVYFTAIFPYVVLLVLFIRGITLEGAYKGIEFYFLKADVSKLLHMSVWNDAATQIFYSLGLAFGTLIALSSYSKYRNNCMRDAIIIAISNCSTSVFAGFVIFSILGFMANELGVEIEDVVSSGSGLAFVAYPQAITKLPYPPLWALLFFFMLITLGLDSQFCMIETISTAIFDQFEFLRPKKPYVVLCLCFLLFLGGLTMCLEGGMYMFELFNWYSAGLAVVIMAISEVLLMAYIHGFSDFMYKIQSEMGIWIPIPLYYYWKVTWMFLTPLLLMIIFLLSLHYSADAYYGDYVFPKRIQALGWMMTAFPIIIIILVGAYVVIKRNLRQHHYVGAR